MPKRPIAFETLRKALAGNLVGRIIQVFALLLSSIVLARSLGPEGLGIVAIVSAAVRMAVVPAQEGASKLSERELAGAIGKSDSAQAHAAMRFNFLMSFVIFLIGMIAIYLFLANSALGDQDDPTNDVMISGLSLFAITITTSAFKGLLRGEGQTVRAVNISNVITFLIPLCYLIWIWGIGPLSPAIALWIQVGAKLAFLPVLVFFVWRYWAVVPKAKPDMAPLQIPRGWYSESFQFTLLGIIAIALTQIATLALSYLSTPEEAGLFRIASRVFLIAGFVTQAAQSAYGPRIAFTWQSGDPAALETPSRMISVLALAGASVFFILFAAFGHWFLIFAFGPEFGPAFVPALIMAATAVSVSFSAMSPRLLKMTGEQSIVLWGSLGGLAVALALNVLLIPKYGATGCAISMLIALTLARVIFSFGVRRHLGFQPLPNIASARTLMSKLRPLKR